MKTRFFQKALDHPWSGVLLLGFCTASLTFLAYPSLFYDERDVGKHLYAIWQVSQGKVLYKDLWHIFGPLSIYWRSFFFSLFGPSLATFFATNGLVLWGSSVLIYLFFSQVNSSRLALLLAFFFLLFFGISQKQPIGEYNFLVPYSIELIDGFFFLLAVVLVSSYTLSGKIQPKSANVLIGISLGFVFLTKYEAFFASLAVITVFFLLAYREKRFPISHLFYLLIGFLFSLFITVCVFLFQGVPPLKTLAYLWLPSKIFLQVRNSPFFPYDLYASVLGTKKLPDAFLKSFSLFSLKISFLTICFFIPKHFKTVFLIGVIIASSFLFLFFYPLCYTLFLILWPLSFNLESLLFFLLIIKKNQKELLLWNTAGFALLLKIFFAPDTYHYGFVLSVPIFLLEIYLFFSSLRNFPLSILPSFFVLLLLATNLQLTQLYIQLKNYPAQVHTETIFLFAPKFTSTTKIEGKLLQIIQEKISPHKTLLNISYNENSTFNFLTRRTSPLRCFTVDPLFLASYGEERFFEDLSRTPPDFIVKLGEPSQEILTPKFLSFLSRLKLYIQKHYHPVWIGKTRKGKQGVLYQRKEKTPY